MGTTHFGFPQPASGSDEWGSAINEAFVMMDARLAEVVAASAMENVFSQPAGGLVFLDQNQEVIVTHPAVTNERLLISVMERAASGGGLTNVEIDFDLADRSRYLEQDAASGTDFSGGKVQLKNGALVYAFADAGGINVHTTGVAPYSINLPSTNTTSPILNAAAYTVEFIVRPIRANRGATLLYFGAGNGSASTDGLWIGIGDTNGVNIISIALNKGSTWQFSASTPLASTLSGSADTHVAVTHTGNVYKIYLNGTLATSGAGAQPNNVARDFNRVFQSFNAVGLGSGYRPNACMRNLRIWSVAKSAAEVAALANADVAVNSAGLTAYYRFDEGVGSTAANSASGSFLGSATMTSGNTNWSSTLTYPLGSRWVSTGESLRFNLGTVSQINSVTMASTLPANTAIKCAVSFDGSSTWKAFNGSSWSTLANGLSGISASGCTIAQIQTGLTNYVPGGSGSLDFAWALSTTSASASPSLDQVTINYDENTHYEIASLGRYGSSADYGIKRVNATQTYVKRLKSGSSPCFINLLT